MALGDGIRRNIATVSKEERDLLLDAIIKLQTQNHYLGQRSETPPFGGVSYWFKQDEIHANTHVHNCPAFVPWHRELMNRFEALIRLIHPELSLHYWDWTKDPRHLPDGQDGFINLFTAEFLGDSNPNHSASELAGEPFQANAAPWRPDGFYVPGANPFRSNNEFDPNNNPFDPPRNLRRNVGGGAPVMDDAAALRASTFQEFHDQIKISHDNAHGFIGGTLGDAHTSFRDPVVFFLHSNLDRIWAMWQLNPLYPKRLEPAHVYDYDPNDWINPITNLPQPEKGSGDVRSGNPWWGFSSPLEPWAGPEAQTAATGIIANVQATRPWAPPENEQVYKDCRHPSVVAPPRYDTTL
jgi:Common central domain of tyrosinase